jgi:hypothetical protein
MEMKRYVCIAAAMLFLLSALVPAVAVSGTEDAVPTADGRVSPGGVIVGGVTELGMLACGIVWEGVRIVLPKGCPLKERDIDDVVGSCRGPHASDEVR